MKKRSILYMVAGLSLLAGTLAPTASKSSAADATRTFSETGKTVSGTFLQYWNTHGGLAQQGLPISDQMQEQSDTDGKTYTMQYFERAVFEMHPENKAPYDVLLSLLGTAAYNDKYGGNAPGQKASTTNPRKFSETGKTIGGVFRTYWEGHGGLAQQGYPISDEFQEQSDTDGKTYTVQYFERAVFELHPENVAPNNVLLSLLGVFSYNSKHGTGGGNPNGGGGGTTSPTSTPSPLPLTPTLSPASPIAGVGIPGWTNMIVTTNNIALFYNSANGNAATARLNGDGTLTILQKYPDPATGNGVFSPGFTIITPGPGNVVMFYALSSGNTSVGNMGDDGIYRESRTFDFSPFWSNIVMDTVTGLTVYHSDTESLTNVGKQNTDGTIVNLKSIPGESKASHQYVAVGNGVWLSYANGTKLGATFTIKPNGDTSLLQSLSDLSPTWSIIASNRRNMVFYDKNGDTMTASVALDGSIVKLKTYSGTGTGTLTQIVAAPNGPFLSYSSSTGTLAIVQVAQDGTATSLHVYQPTK